jgi:hypothetical protein
MARCLVHELGGAFSCAGRGWLPPLPCPASGPSKWHEPASDVDARPVLRHDPQGRRLHAAFCSESLSCSGDSTDS